MKTIVIVPGNYVLVDPCRWGGAPRGWRIGVIERELEQLPPRFLIRYLTPDDNGLSFRIHTPRSMRAIGSEAHVRGVFDEVLSHLQGFGDQLAKIEKRANANEKKWSIYSDRRDALQSELHEVQHEQYEAMKKLSQPGLLHWTRNGGLR